MTQRTQVLIMSKPKNQKLPAPTAMSVRGKIISNPMPFHDEFPMNTPGAGVPIREIEAARGTPSPSEPQMGIAVSDFSEAPISTSPPPRCSPSQRTPSPGQIAREKTRFAMVRASMVSVPSSGSIRREKKHSGVRVTFRKLFGRKKKAVSSSSSASEDNGTIDIRNKQHESDPSPLRAKETKNISSTSSTSSNTNNNNKKNKNKSHQNRSASLPVNEFNRALRSHSVLAKDCPVRNNGTDARRRSPSTPPPPVVRNRPRRATTSTAWSPDKSAGFADWMGLSPRPTSTHPRESRLVSDAETSAAIGMAISNDKQLNRRSRSAGELRDGAPVDSRFPRRRSDEIKYWRESHDPVLLNRLSSHRSIEEAMPVEGEEESEAQDAQPFNFGTLSELAGMKITHAANLETRVHEMEERLFKMERMFYQLPETPKRGNIEQSSSTLARTSTNESEIILPNQPRLLKVGCNLARRPSTVFTHRSNLSLDAYCPTNKISAELHASSLDKSSRPLSTSTTIRGVASSSPSPQTKDEFVTIEQHVDLIKLINAEQSARRHLESAVRNLQKQVTTLNASKPTYPPASVISSVPARRPGYSASDSDDSSDDGQYGDHGEIFDTPHEEMDRFDGEIFGEVVTTPPDEGDMDVDTEGDMDGWKGASRTLSLSQLTRVKGNGRSDKQI